MAGRKDDRNSADRVSTSGKRRAGTHDVSGSGHSPVQGRDHTELSSRSEVDAFLDAVKQAAPAVTGDGRGRLIFSLDATASRQRTWDRAMALQSDMFIHTRGLSSLDEQLVY